MRLAWYAGASTALAAGVVVSAFHQRANFYSAMVYLSQSNICLMILVNLVFLVYGSFMYGLQRVCFGQLRPVEIEQLYEKAWFAVTETCLAMTIFREELGAFFLVMFTALVTGKIWGWIGEGRIEVLEQQPPANPRLFHTRVSISLALSLIYDLWLLRYAVSTVIQQARPDMMVMFLFEFAILSVVSLHTGLRYILALVDANILKNQTRQRLEDRRKELRNQRAEILRRRASGEATEAETNDPLPNEDDVEEMDIEVPGWESKGQWVLALDICSDFFKLCIYGAFFCVLLTFYGLPIHIMRDLFLTTRSFIKRLTSLLRYRQAMKDIDRYADATEEELTRENTCIICREEMHPWNATDASQMERSRPKKLPCGHILHSGCLKSWIERQAVCPTCRRSVMLTDAPPAAGNRADAVMFRFGLNFNGAGGNGGGGGGGAGGQHPPAPAADGAPQGVAPGEADNNQQAPAPARNGMRMINFGPFRLGFAQGGLQDINAMAQQLANPQDGVNRAAPPAGNAAQSTHGTGSARSTTESISNELREIEQRIQRSFVALNLAQQETATLRFLIAELQRIRMAAANSPFSANGAAPMPPPPMPGVFGPQYAPPQGTISPMPPHFAANLPPQVPVGPVPAQFAVNLPAPMPQMSPQLQRNASAAIPPMHASNVPRLGPEEVAGPIPAGHSDLPRGVTIPPGWTLLPLERLEGNATVVIPGVAPATHNGPSGEPSGPHQGPRSQSVGQASSSSTPYLAPPSSTAPPMPARTTHAVQINAPESQAGSSSVASESTQEASRTEPVAQPTPVMPNWGGSAQLFGDGLQTRGGSNTSHPSDADGEEGEESTDRGSEKRESSQRETGNAATGSARAVTVEEVDDDSS